MEVLYFLNSSHGGGIRTPPQAFACGNLSRQNITDGYCGPPPPAFALQHCYASVCPETNGLSGDVGGGGVGGGRAGRSSPSSSGAAARRRLFGKPTVE